MENSLIKITELYNLYKNSPNTISKLDFYICKQLPGLLDKFNKQEQKIIFRKESEKYINDFLTNPEKQYFYIKIQIYL